MKRELHFIYNEYSTPEALVLSDQLLMNKAKETLANSYAPYSGFNVGCALRLSNGEIVTGANQENAAYPAGLCAERVALFSAKSNYPEVLVDTVVICASKAGVLLAEPIAPCGGCRQVFVEVRNRQEEAIRLILYGADKIYVINDASFLMPFSFSQNNL